MCPSGHFRDAFSVFLESAKADIGYFLAVTSVAGRFPDLKSGDLYGATQSVFVCLRSRDALTHAIDLSYSPSL